MKLSTLLLTILIMVATCQAEFLAIELEKIIQDEVAFKADGEIKVNNYMGSVSITAWEEDLVSFVARVTVRARKELTAQKLLDDITLVIDLEGNTLEINTKTPRDYTLRNISFTVDIEMQIPVKSSLKVGNQFGDVSVIGTRGVVTVNNQNGEVKIIKAGETEITNRFGDVSINAVTGRLKVNCANSELNITEINADCDIENSFGDISVENVTGELKIDSRNGAVNVNNAGKSQITNSFGDTRLRNINGDLICETQNGDMDITFVSGEARIENSFGNIYLRDIAGELRVFSQNSELEVIKITSPVTIRNSFGRIHLTDIDGDIKIRNANGDVVAHEISGAANINTDFGDIDGRRISGNVTAGSNSGNCELTDIGGQLEVETSFGDIRIEDAGPQLKCTAVNGSIVIMDLRPGIPEMNLESSFGMIRVELKNDVSARLDLRTSFGSINVEDIKGHLVENLSSTSFTGQLGSGDGTINCQGANSSIDIIRK